ncbi:hypothetical protein SteCoe_1455 [Stentor coeruleus]|uniref:RING-type domain-containing protein n=1 Tax=Stentor coeruleus TaxID=5963 RepID=A0A1R2D1Y1_9CILI|nr:hypothetical protein SteCoe_1455 [Stentor coeruleus]
MINLSLKDLYKQAAELSKLLSTPSHNINSEDLTEYLIQFIYFLNLMNYRTDVRISIYQDKCIQCSRSFNKSITPDHIYLTCQNHLLCSKNCANIFTENNISNCPHCNIPLAKSFYDNILGHNNILEDAKNQDNVEDAKNQDNVENDFDCKKCKEKCNFNICIVLSCGCMFCKNCLKKFLEDTIYEFDNLDELNCPDCINKHINERIIRYVVALDAFKEFETKKGIQFPDEEVKKIIFYCKKLNCEYNSQVDDAEEYECPKCNLKSCPKCSDVPHIGHSCKAYKNFKENGNFNPLDRHLQWIPCPWCEQYIQKTTRCPFITCNSIICKGEKHFCFKCKSKLNHDCEDHDCMP